MKTTENKQKKNKVTYKNFFRILKFFKQEKKLFYKYIFLASVFIALGFVQPIIMGNLLASLGQLETQSVINMLAMYTVLMVALFAVRHIWLKANYKLALTVISNLRLKLLNHMLYVKTKIFDRNQTGKFKERIVNDGNQMIWNFIDSLDSFIQIIASALFIGYIFTLNYFIGGLLVAFVFFYYLIDKNKNVKFIKNQKKFKEQAEVFNSYGTEVIKGIRDVKILNAKPSIVNSFAGIQKEFYDLFYHRNIVNNRYWFVLRLLNTFFFVGILALGFYLVTIGQFSLAGLLIVYSSFDKIKNVTNLFSMVREKMSIGEVSAKRAFEIEDDNITFEKETFGNIELIHVNGQIEFKDVKFDYIDNGKLIFNNLNLKIEAGQTVGIIGESGGGKSTLLGLISKMYYVDGGQLLIDNININDLTEKSLRKAISYVSQNPYLFNDSIINNLKIGYPNLTVEDAVEACKLANIYDYIKTLENGFDTIVGENGVQLSGGQRQRIAIARALVNKNKIILLDEATSALDNDSQEKIKEAISRVSRDHTVIIVAHRLSTVIDCDRIIAVVDGKIVADGTHKKLIKESEYYKELYSI